jgi:hypothetical protein
MVVSAVRVWAKKIVEKTRILLGGCDMCITAEKTVGFG